jgi:hypothetical protein
MSSPEPLPTGALSTFSRAQVLRAGYSDSEIKAAVRSGRWLRVRRGGYSVAPADPSALTLERLHLLRIEHVAARLGSGSVLSHQSAVLFHGLPVWGAPLGNVHVTRLGAGSTRVRAGLKSHRRSLADHEVTAMGSIQVTTPARALVDMACEVGFESAVCSMDAALRAPMVSPESLNDAVERVERLTGAGNARRAVAFANAGSESVGESRMRVAIGELGLPSPILQHEFRGPFGRLVGRVDFWWPAECVIAEFDGLVKYRGSLGRPVEVVVGEKLREDALRELTGATFVRVVWSDLQTRDELGRKLRRALDHRLR